MKNLTLIIAVVGVFLSASRQAEAVTYAFSYNFSATPDAAELKGTLEGDPNAITGFIDNIRDVSYTLDFFSGPADVIAAFIDAFNDPSGAGSPVALPIVSIDGTIVDFLVSDATIQNGFGIFSDPINFPDTSIAIYTLGANSTSEISSFDDFNGSWEISELPIAAVPDAGSSFLLMSLALTGLGVVRQRLI